MITFDWKQTGRPPMGHWALSEEEFVRRAIIRLRDPRKSLGIHTRNSGFNEAFRLYFGHPSYEALGRLSSEGAISMRPTRGGARLYLTEEFPDDSVRHSEAREIPVASKQIEDLKFSQIRKRSDWPVVFSCNPKRQVWVFKRWGYHHDEDRYPVKHPMVDEIVDVLLQIRRKGGRIFVNSKGAYTHAQGQPLYWFVIFNPARPTGASKARSPQSRTLEERRAILREKIVVAKPPAPAREPALPTPKSDNWVDI